MSEATQGRSRRAKMYELFAHEGASSAGRWLRAALILLILLSVGTAILESVPAYGNVHATLLDGIQVFTTLCFAIEYGLRIWVAPEEPGKQTDAEDRWRYIFSLPGFIDLLAAFPFTLLPRALGLDWLDI